MLAWFAAWPAASASALLAAMALVLGVASALLAAPPRVARPSTETLAVSALALLYRLPAMAHPWGWVNTDGAYGAFVALHILDGLRPAPVFTEGASYQGTLKGHLAALFSALTGAEDLSRMLVLASVLLGLVFIVATMSLARRIGGRAAAVAAGLYLALGPKFLTTFSLNSVGQYVDVLALGGAALAVLAPVLEGEPRHPLRIFASGLLLGAAFWQQPVAIAFIATAALALLLRRGEDALTVWAWWGVGLVAGVMPVLIWNARHDWATGSMLSPGDGLHGQLGALPTLASQTITTSLPVLAGVSPGHPWLALGPALIRGAAAALVLGALVGLVALQRRRIAASLSAGRPASALLPPVLFVASVVSVWATAAGAVYSRPRYLLPLMAATAIHLGVTWAWLWARSRAAAAVLLALVLALNVSGMASRLDDGGPVTRYYAGVIRSLETKGVRTGYADFSLSAPITMFTRERILLSSRLGPTPAYEPARHEEKVAREGPDAYVLRPDDDPERFAAALRALGVTYRVDLDPVPVFYGFSRRVRVEEVHGFRGDTAAPPAPEEE